MPPSIQRLNLPEVLLIQPEVFGDERGFFMEVWNQRHLNEAVGREIRFVQDNHSKSGRGVLRGLHYQLAAPQGKLVRVVAGAAFDVAVDVRKGSPTVGGYVTAELSAENRAQLWIPEGFAHGFLVLTDFAEVLYKTTTYYDPSSERSIRWNDPELGIDWPVVDPVLSDRDQRAKPLAESELID